VDINEEAMVVVVEFQRAYEANSKLTALDQLTEDTISILPST
jgi:hypothetical protein